MLEIEDELQAGATVRVNLSGVHMRNALLGCTLLSLMACGSPDPAIDALAFVVEDMVARVPKDVPPQTAGPFLASRLQSGDRPPVPEAILEITDLPVATDSLIEDRDQSLVVLSLFEPRVFQPDSIVTVADWLVFPVEGRYWGQDWHYVLDCDPTCVQVQRSGPGFLN